MKIAYTINNNSEKSVFFFKKEDGSIGATWSNEPSQIASLELSEKGVKDYLRKPSKLMAEANNIYLTVNSKGDLNLPIYKMAETFYSKMGGLDYITALNQGSTVGQIYIPFKDSGSDEIAIRLNVKEEELEQLKSFIPDVVEVKNEDAEFAKFYYDNSPKLSVSEITFDNEWSNIKVQLTYKGQSLNKSGIRIFAKSASGYIAKREVYTDEQGVVEFKVTPMGLNKGEEMKVEFGFKFVSNLVSANVVA